METVGPQSSSQPKRLGLIVIGGAHGLLATSQGAPLEQTEYLRWISDFAMRVRVPEILLMQHILKMFPFINVIAQTQRGAYAKYTRT